MSFPRYFFAVVAVVVVILLHFACWFLLICSHIKCEIKYRQQRTFIKRTYTKRQQQQWQRQRQKKLTTAKRIMCSHYSSEPTIYI